MTLYEYYATFPNGEVQEIRGPLSPAAIVDVNGIPYSLPLSSVRTLAYRIARKRTNESRGIVETHYVLEQLSAADLIEYT